MLASLSALCVGDNGCVHFGLAYWSCLSVVVRSIRLRLTRRQHPDDSQHEAGIKARRTAGA